MNQEQLQTAITMRAQDQSYKAISEATGLNPGTIYHKLAKDEINQLIKEAQSKLIHTSLAIAVQNQIDKISAGNVITKKIVSGEKLNTGAVKLAELAHDSEKQLLQSVGIHNAHTQSIQVNNILVDNRSELSPAVEAVLIGHLQGNKNVDNSASQAVDNSIASEIIDL